MAQTKRKGTSSQKSQKPFIPSGGSALLTRTIHVAANAAHLWVDLTQNEERPDELDLDITGSAIPDGAALNDGGATFTLADPDAIRALGEALLLLADRAEKQGMFAALRTRQAGQQG